MGANELLEHVEGLGLLLYVEGEKLKLRGFRGHITDDLREAVRARKADLIQLLFEREERAALSSCPEGQDAAAWVKAVESEKVQTILRIFRGEIVSIIPGKRKEAAA